MEGDMQLYLDGDLMDLDSSTVIALTKQVNNVAALQDRNSNRSNEFIVPFTEGNNSTLGFANAIQSSGTKPYTKMSAKLIQRGVELVPSGYAIITKSDTSYKVTVYDGNNDFFSLLEQKKLIELDLSDLDHIWDDTEIPQSAVDRGFYYPLINYNSSTIDDVNFQPHMTLLFPAVKIMSVAQRIVEAQGWTLDVGSYADDFRYQNTLLPFCKDKFENRASFDALQGYNVSGEADAVGTPSGQDFDDVNAYHLVLNTMPSDTWTPTADFIFSITARMTLTYTVGISGSSGVDSVLTFRKNSGGFDTIAVVSVHIPEGDAGTVELNLSGKELRAITGQGYEFVYINFSTGVPPVHFQVESFTFQIEVSPTIVWHKMVDMSNQLPDMSQKDFMKGIMNVFGIVPESFSQNKTLKWRSLNELKTTPAKDMSLKYVEREGDELGYRLDGYYQTNDFKWKQDEEVTPDYGNSTLLIADETLPLRGTVVELPFGATRTKTSIVDNTTQYDVPFMQSIVQLKSLTQQKVKTTPRLLMLNHQTLVDPPIRFELPGGATADYLVVDFCHFDNITVAVDEGFEVITGLDWTFLLADYYETTEEMLGNAKTLKVLMKLNEIDVQNFDHFTPWYIEKFASNFFVNKISNFKSGELTLCELIKL